jgi:hypothetical protein
MPTDAEGSPVAALFEVNEVLCGAGVDATLWGAVQFDSDLVYEFVGSAEIKPTYTASSIQGQNRGPIITILPQQADAARRKF